MKVVYYRAASGRVPVREFLDTLSPEVQAHFINSVVRLEDGEQLEMPLSRNLSAIHKGLHELRLKDFRGIYRIFYYIKVGDMIYMLHAFKKKSQQLLRKEIETALKRIREV